MDTTGTRQIFKRVNYLPSGSLIGREMSVSARLVSLGRFVSGARAGLHWLQVEGEAHLVGPLDQAGNLQAGPDIFQLEISKFSLRAFLTWKYAGLTEGS